MEEEDLPPQEKFPERLVIVAGTYDGVVAGWDSSFQPGGEGGNPSKKEMNDSGDEENDDENLHDPTQSKSKQLSSLIEMLNPRGNEEHAYLKMNFAFRCHDGSVRSLSIASGVKQQQQQQKGQVQVQKSTKKKKNNTPPKLPTALLTAGYDENLAIFNLQKQKQSGELKTPSDLGTAMCSSFAPPDSPVPTHALIGLTCGKIIIYLKKDWSIQHILDGHDAKGVTALAVHPTGKMALSGGRDGKIILWDLMRGRQAFVYRIPSPRKGMKPTINHIVWSHDGKRYAYCTHDGKVTAREMETGQDLLDINLPASGRANQICFVGGDDGLFLAAACNDGSLPMFAVGSVDEEEEETETRRALMAIEPVQGVLTAGDERFKCIQCVRGGSGFLVVTANSGGVISLIDLEGAARMLLDDHDDDDDDDQSSEKDSDDDNSSNEDDDEELAAEILESVRVGSGARITSIAAWSSTKIDNDVDDEMQNEDEEETTNEEEDEKDLTADTSKKRKIIEVPVTVPLKNSRQKNIEMDEEDLKRARALVSQAKEVEKKKKKKKSKKKK